MEGPQGLRQWLAGCAEQPRPACRAPGSTGACRVQSLNVSSAMSPRFERRSGAPYRDGGTKGRGPGGWSGPGRDRDAEGRGGDRRDGDRRDGLKRGDDSRYRGRDKRGSDPRSSGGWSESSRGGKRPSGPRSGGERYSERAAVSGMAVSAPAVIVMDMTVPVAAVSVPIGMTAVALRGAAEVSAVSRGAVAAPKQDASVLHDGTVTAVPARGVSAIVPTASRTGTVVRSVMPTVGTPGMSGRPLVGVTPAQRVARSATSVPPRLHNRRLPRQLHRPTI